MDFVKGNIVKIEPDIWYFRSVNLSIMHGRVLILLTLFSTGAYAQCKSFKLGPSNDTLNCIDVHGFKQGKWVIHMDPLRGNPGFEEEGIYKNNLKNGQWKQFNLIGDKIADENYKDGNKHGKCSYYTVAGLVREESWKAPADARRMFDTIMVQDPKRTNSYQQVIIKTDGKSIRHGIWKYYDPVYGNMTNVETYVLDVLKAPGDDDPLKKIKKISDTATVAPNTIINVPKPLVTPRFGQKLPSKKKSNVQ